MKFILTFSLPAETRDEAITRFLETKGQPPPGVTLLGRWTQLDLCGGFVLLESEDPKALTAFAHGWSDLLELTLAPVLEDQELSEVLRCASGQSAQPEGLPQAAPIVADQELPDRTHPEAVHGDVRAEEPLIAPAAGRPRPESPVGEGISYDQVMANPEDVTGAPAADIPRTRSG